MEARFAGSQRVGDRRRRRLAVGADDTADNPNADSPARPEDLSAPTGSFRTLEGAHTDSLQSELPTSLFLPVAKIIPAEGWKYLVGGLLGLAASAAIIVVGCFAPRFRLFAGPGISDLFALPNGRLAQWFSSLLLLLCAQLAVLIWWARSRSLEDFDGRYWLWIRTAAAWLVFSSCVAIEAHDVALNTLLAIRPGLSREWAILGWMIPAAILGSLLVGALAREMRGCRTSRTLLLLACACHLSTAGLHLKFESFFSPDPRAVLIQIGLLTGHVALFVSMWLHARHVLYFSADPAPRLRRAWRIPRPHFGLSQWRLMQAWQNRRRVLASPAPLEGPKSRRKRPVRDSSAKTGTPATSESVPSIPTTSLIERPSKPRVRFDSRHLEHSQRSAVEAEAPDQSDARRGQESGEKQSPIATGSWNFGPAESTDPASETAADTTACTAGAAESDEVSDEGTSKPELRGLSKKQRRRLMQEMRDRERDSRR